MAGGCLRNWNTAAAGVGRGKLDGAAAVATARDRPRDLGRDTGRAGAGVTAWVAAELVARGDGRGEREPNRFRGCSCQQARGGAEGCRPGRRTEHELGDDGYDPRAGRGRNECAERVPSSVSGCLRVARRIRARGLDGPRLPGGCPRGDPVARAGRHPGRAVAGREPAGTRRAEPLAASDRRATPAVRPDRPANGRGADPAGDRAARAVRLGRIGRGGRGGGPARGGTRPQRRPVPPGAAAAALTRAVCPPAVLVDETAGPARPGAAGRRRGDRRRPRGVCRDPAGLGPGGTR